MSIETKEDKLRGLREQQANLATAIRNAEDDLHRAKQARASEPQEGSKVLITVNFPEGTTTYEYMAMRTAPDLKEPHARWYVTGRAGKVTWDYILRLVERGTYSIQLLIC